MLLLRLRGPLEICRSHLKLSESNRAVVSLDEDVISGSPAPALGGPGGAFGFDILLDKLVVEMDGDESGVFQDVAIFIEAGSAEFDHHFLPFSGRLGGVHDRRHSIKPFWISFVIPAAVKTSHVAIADFRFAVGVEDLDLVSTLEVDTGVGVVWDEEFGFDGAVAIFFDCLKVARFGG